MFSSRCSRRCARVNDSIRCTRAHRMSIGDATFSFRERYVGFHVRTVMISSFLTGSDFESSALAAQAPVKTGRCDGVAPAAGRWALVRTLSDRALASGPLVRTNMYEALGSTTTNPGGNAP